MRSHVPHRSFRGEAQAVGMRDDRIRREISLMVQARCRNIGNMQSRGPHAHCDDVGALSLHPYDGHKPTTDPGPVLGSGTPRNAPGTEAACRCIWQPLRHVWAAEVRSQSDLVCRSHAPRQLACGAPRQRYVRTQAAPLRQLQPTVG